MPSAAPAAWPPARRTADRREPWSRTRAMTCHSASLPCRSEPRAGGDDAEVASQLRQQPTPPHRGPFRPPPPPPGCRRDPPRQVRLVPEREPDRLHFLRLAMGEVGDRAVLDLAGLAIGLAQQVARIGLAVQAGGRAVDEHYDYDYAIKPTVSQDDAMIISGYIFRAKTPSTH